MYANMSHPAVVVAGKKEVPEREEKKRWVGGWREGEEGEEENSRGVLSNENSGRAGLNV